MHGTPLPVIAEIAIPDASHCFRLVAPFLAAGVLLFLGRNSDEIFNRLFPHWEWERKLGWLNFAAHRRADAVMRWLGYFVYAILVVALAGIVWAAKGLSAMGQWDNVQVFSDLLFRIPVLLVCLGFWFYYLGGYLLPRMRGQYEEEELEKYREEQKEHEHDRNPNARFNKPQTKSRLNSSASPNRGRPRR
jgi:hypothetical protein